MERFAGFVVLALVVFSSAFSGAQEPVRSQKKDKVVGTIWKFKAVNGTDSEMGHFRVFKKEVFKGNDKVGFVEPRSESETTLFINEFPKLNGKVVLRKTDRTPPVWTGVLLHQNGSRWNIEVEIGKR